jgi:hypothetical protein
MSAQNVTARRGAAISAIAATILLILIAAFDNQWLEKWRAARIGGGADAPGVDSWVALPVSRLDALAWRATKAHGESTRDYASQLTAAVLTALFAGLLLALVCRGLSSERGRWPLFLGGWFATGFGAGLGLVAGALIAGSDVTPVSKASTYYEMLGAGAEFGLFAGWLVGFVAVLVYGSTPGMDGVEVDDYDYTPPGYDYGTAPSAYSYTPTSPYETGEPPTTIVQPLEDPYRGRDSY